MPIGSGSDLVTLRVTAVAEIKGDAAREVALRLLEDTARTLQLKLLLLADSLPGVDIAHRVGHGTFESVSLSGDSLLPWIENEEQSR